MALHKHQNHRSVAKIFIDINVIFYIQAGNFQNNPIVT